MIGKYKKIMKRVAEANKSIKREKLVKLTWGNISEIDRGSGLIFIKPSGYDMDKLKWRDVSVMNVDGTTFYSKHKPSVDFAIHREIYLKNKHIKAIAHTHSNYSTAFAQARKEIKVFGTTHADTFNGPIKITEPFDVKKNLEIETGEAINKIIEKTDNAVLVAGHGPFIFGKDANEALKNSIILEEVASINIKTKMINKDTPILEKSIQQYHYNRKNGKNKYYGQ